MHHEPTPDKESLTRKVRRMLAARKLSTWSHPDLYTDREVTNTSLRHDTDKQRAIMTALDEEEWMRAQDLVTSTGLNYAQVWGGLQTLYSKDLIEKQELHGRSLWRKH